LLAILGVELISRKLTISPEGVALRSLFLNRSIRFAYIESIDVKAIQSADEPGVERAKIRGTEGQSITLDSSMPGYRPVLELARSHAAAKISREGLGDVAKGWVTLTSPDRSGRERHVGRRQLRAPHN
jgi:hypothetical protein